MKYTRNEMVSIATKAEARNENPAYEAIMKKFDRVLEGKTKCVRLSANEKDLISYMYENTCDETEKSILKKLYK